MKKKSHSIFAVFALALVIAAAIVVFALIRKYTPSKEHEDLTTYYHLTNSDEVAIVLNNEVIDGHICQISIDGIIYPDKYKSSKEILEEIIKLYEKRIISNPTQWFWFQDRWFDGK